jgi:hypothetical protein
MLVTHDTDFSPVHHGQPLLVVMDLFIGRPELSDKNVEHPKNNKNDKNKNEEQSQRSHGDHFRRIGAQKDA